MLQTSNGVDFLGEKTSSQEKKSPTFFFKYPQNSRELFLVQHFLFGSDFLVLKWRSPKNTQKRSLPTAVDGNQKSGEFSYLGMVEKNQT